MILSRRSALLGIGAALAAPAVVRAESLMKIVAPRPALITPEIIDLLQCANDLLLTYRAIYEGAFYTVTKDGIRLLPPSKWPLVSSHHLPAFSKIISEDWPHRIIEFSA